MIKRYRSVWFAIGLFFAVFSLRTEGFAAENRLFGYPHLAASPLTLPGGRLLLGSQVSFGVTDFLQVGTDLFRDAYEQYNANAKLGIIDRKVWAAALTLGYENYDLQTISASNPSGRIQSWQPGAVIAVETFPNLAWFYGANFEITETTIQADGIEASGLVRGTNGNVDIAYAYNQGGGGEEGRRKRRRGRSSYNVLSAGVSYDFTYKLFGFGLSHYWPGFRIGFHYYPSASRQRILPIIAGGAVVEL